MRALLAPVLLAAAAHAAPQAPDPLRATLDRQLQHVAITRALRACDVDEAWERIEGSVPHAESEPHRLLWAEGLRRCGAEERADALLAGLAAGATSVHVRLEARAELAEAPARLGDFAEALRRLRALDPLHPNVARRVGWLERRRGNVDEALATWRRAERGRSWVLRRAVVDTLADLGRAEEALAAWREPGERVPHLVLGEGYAGDEDLREARLLLAAVRPAEARALLDPYLEDGPRGFWELRVAARRGEGRPYALAEDLAGRPQAVVLAAHAIKKLLERDDAGDLRALWSAAHGRGPLAADSDLALELLARREAALELARAELEGDDDLLALALLAHRGDADTIAAVEPRLAAARTGARQDAPSLAYVLALLGTPEARATLARWSEDPVLGPQLRRVALRYGPCEPVRISRADLVEPLR